MAELPDMLLQTLPLCRHFRKPVMKLHISVPTTEWKRTYRSTKIPYIGISSGKLRRYFDWKNFSDPFKVLKGYGRQSPSCANSNRTLSFPKVDLCLFRLSLPQSTAIFRQLSTNPISHRDLQTKSQSAVQKKYAVISRRP